MASDPMEFRGVLSRAADVRPAEMGIDWARTGTLGVHSAVFAANGVGWKPAAAAVDAVVKSWPPDSVISTGYCGALEESLASGDIVVGTCVVAGGRSWPVLPVTSEAPFRTGVVRSVDKIARTASQKAELGRAGASVVEMEAAGVAERAKSLGLPFRCVRVVTDLASETMANDFDSALRPDGHFATMHILLGALRQPTVRIPELLRLRSRCVRSARILGDFLADCRF